MMRSTTSCFRYRRSTCFISPVGNGGLPACSPRQCLYGHVHLHLIRQIEIITEESKGERMRTRCAAGEATGAHRKALQTPMKRLPHIRFGLPGECCICSIDQAKREARQQQKTHCLHQSKSSTKRKHIYVFGTEKMWSVKKVVHYPGVHVYLELHNRSIFQPGQRASDLRFLFGMCFGLW